MRSGYLKSVLIVLVLIGPALLFQQFDLKFALPAAIFVTTVILWFSELLPLAVTGMLVPVLISVFGVAPAKEAFSAFGNQILFLFIGCFLLAQSMQKHGWDKRMAYIILSSRFSSGSPASLTVLVAIICWVLSMWISNTATCAMMTPICLGIVAVFDGEFENHRDKENFTTRLLLICAFASSVGGLATPVGTPPNLIALQFLRDYGVQIDFLRWMSFAAPVSIAMLIVLLTTLSIRYPVSKIELSSIQAHFKKELKTLGPLKTEEIQTAIVFLVAVVLWVAPGMLNLFSVLPEIAEYLSKYLSMSIVGIVAGISLFILPTGNGANLVWEDAKGIDWGTILLFGGGLTLGAMLSNSGLAVEIGTFIFNPEFDFWLIVILAVVSSILISEFASNTASASVIIPIALATFAKLALPDAQATAIILGCAFGASYGFMLPVSTPPNAIIFGTKKIKLKDMARTGVIFDLSGFILITIAVLWLIPLFL